MKKKFFTIDKQLKVKHSNRIKAVFKMNDQRICVQFERVKLEDQKSKMHTHNITHYFNRFNRLVC